MSEKNPLGTPFEGQKRDNRLDSNQSGQRYDPKKVLKKIRDCGLDKKKLMKVLNKEEYGAGFEGTCGLVNKYLKDTPGQSIEKKRKKRKRKK